MSTADPAPPREIVVDAKAAPGDSSDGSGSAMAPILVSVFAAGALAKWVEPLLGLAALVIATAALVMLQKPRHGRFVLRVDGELLEIARERRREPVARIPLADVVDVTLDRVTRASGRGGSTERTRLALERSAPDAPIFVPEDHVTPIEAQEWLGKVRVFLRKHGWLPRDERAGGQPAG